MVIGPTPPGTGVIAPATAAALSKSTSPTSFVFPSTSIRLMPTSITVAPGLIQSPFTISGRPTAATTMSARRTTPGRSRVREWAIVTVQLSPSSKLGHRLADDVRPADHHGLHPRQVAVKVAQQHQAAKRRAGHHGLLPRPQQPHVRDVEAVDVLRRVDGVDDEVGIEVLRQRQLDEDAVHRRVGVQPRDERQKIGLGGLGGQLVLEGRHPGLGRLLALVADVDLARRVLAHQHDRKPRA